MRVLFAIDPSIAHLYPMVPTAWALQSAGHEVRLASPAAFSDQIAATGLTPVPLGDAAWAARISDDPLEPKGHLEAERYAEVLGLGPEEREYWYLFFQYLLTPTADYLRPDRPEAAALIDFARAWRPDLVIWDLTQAAGAIAARVSGAAHARLVFAYDPASWSLDRLAAGRDALVAAGLDENPLATLVRPLADRYGVELDDELLVGQWTLDTAPPGLELPTRTRKVPLRYVPYNGAAPVPDWLREPAERPRICLTLGESYRRFIRGDWNRTPMLLEALADLDVDVVATLNDVQLDGRIPPPNVRTLDYLPLNLILPTCAAVIHHGGLGTFQAAVAARVPQLVCDTRESIMLRMEEDVSEESTEETGIYRSGVEYGVRELDAREQRPAVRWVMPAKKLEATPVANYVVSRGAGVRLDHQTQSVTELREAIRTVLDDASYRRGAEAIYDVWRAMPSPNDVVPVLESLAGDARNRR
ncbi:nucleotide disphospho-sugar-binding domain-containing protein [Micromonospora lutea]|uniref:Glycosyl transferase n=1 Tax=Micromonospora lutea TaxID=419825 RepID=A0ABQ4IYF6_9ACTN|nr:nucleotide disphospho-sugar-binding domain-containing protein [Micromonospora lutea]GIJ22949.1 glycosyl transferase [Micromonospora lutea]